MPNELPADDISHATTHEAADGWGIEDAGKLRASATELATDFEHVTEAPVDPSSAAQERNPLHGPAKDDDADATPPADDEPEPDRATADEKKKGRSPATRTKELREEIEILTAKKHAEARELEEIERRRAAARAALEPERPAPVSDARRPAVPEKPTWKGYDESGKSWDDYVEARDAYADALRAAERHDDRMEMQREFEARQAEIESRAHAERSRAEHRTRIESAKSRYADFDQVVEANLSSIPNIPFLNDAVRNHPNGGELLYQLAKHPDEAAVLASLDFTNAMMDAVMASSDPTPLLLHLATNPAEHQELLRMSPRQALIRLGALQSRVTPPVREHGSRPAARVSSAAPPIRPVGGAGVTADASDDEDMDFGPEYIRRMNARDLKRGVRP